MSLATAPRQFAPIRLAGSVDSCGHLPFNRAVRLGVADGHIPEFKGGRLISWQWPIRPCGPPGKFERVPPDQLLQHRNGHEFAAPGCLCAQDLDQPAFTESKIFLKLTGDRHVGQWIAACARGHCKYWVTLEKGYTSRNCLVHHYPLRAVAQHDDEPADIFSGEQFSSPLSSPSATPKRKRFSSATLSTPRKRSRLAEGAVPIGDEDVETEISDFRKLLKLDDHRAPGLSLAEFKRLFRLCNCGLVMTASAHSIRHECPGKDIIDLTIDIRDMVQLIRGA